MAQQGFLNVSHNFSGEVGQFVIVEWVKSTAQGTPVIGHVTGTGLGSQNDTDVTEVFYPAPHVNEQLQIINLPEVWHLVRFWRSSDGVAKDLLLLSLAGNARTGALYPIQRFEYVVDRGFNNTTPVVTDGIWSDPVQNDTGLRDTRLLDQVYWVEERGTGSLLTSEIIDRSDVGGGFDFTEPGKVFNTDGVYVVSSIIRVDAGGEDSGAVATGDDIFILATDQDYNPLTMGSRTLIADFATTVGTLTIPNLLLVADSRFKLQTHTGSQRNVVIQLDVGDTVNFRKQAVNKIILGEGEGIEILFMDNVMYVLDHTTNHERLGQRIWSDLRLALNTLIADGTTYNQADYPRAIELLDSLPAGAVVNYTTWNTSQIIDGVTRFPNKGFFARDNIAGTFRVPDMRSQTLKALSNTTGAIIAGRYENQQLMLHDHDLRGSFLFGGYDGGGNTFFRIRNLTDGFDGSSKVVSDAGGADNIVNNLGLYPLICI